MLTGMSIWDSPVDQLTQTCCCTQYYWRLYSMSLTIDFLRLKLLQYSMSLKTVLNVVKNWLTQTRCSIQYYWRLYSMSLMIDFHRLVAVFNVIKDCTQCSWRLIYTDLLLYSLSLKIDRSTQICCLLNVVEGWLTQTCSCT